MPPRALPTAHPAYRVAEYGVWRAVGSQQALPQKSGGAAWPTLEAAAAMSVVSSPYAVEELAGTTYYWELVGTQPSEGEAGYAWVVSTTADSTALANDPTLVRVTARAGSGAAFWQSQPDRAYSVDNLAPAAVQQFEGANTNRSLWLSSLGSVQTTECEEAESRSHAEPDGERAVDDRRLQKSREVRASPAEERGAHGVPHGRMCTWKAVGRHWTSRIGQPTIHWIQVSRN